MNTGLFSHRQRGDLILPSFTSQPQTFSRRRLKLTEMWFYCQMLRIPRTEDLNSERVLRKTGTTNKLILTIWKKKLRFLQNLMRKKENLTLMECTECKRSYVKQWITNLCEWIAEERQKLFWTRKDRDLWRAMIKNYFEQEKRENCGDLE